jgi:hypothetical protein
MIRRLDGGDAAAVIALRQAALANEPRALLGQGQRLDEHHLTLDLRERLAGR